jgi:large subunit ribosomal protein L22
MAFRASHRHARISARKVRLLADMVRNKPADEALDILRFQPQRGAVMLARVIESAVANAQNPDHPLNRDTRRGRALADLVVTTATVDGGPMFKRMRPRARGMSFMIRKRSSHINVVIEDINDLS